MGRQRIAGSTQAFLLYGWKRAPSFLAVWAILGSWGLTLRADMAYAAPLPQPSESLVAWIRSQPSVVWCGDPGSTFSLEFHVENRRDIASVAFTLYRPAAEEIELNDQGVAGDARAGDMVFTGQGLSVPCFEPALKYGNAVGFHLAEFSARLVGGGEILAGYYSLVGVVDLRFKDVFDVIEFGDGLSATAYAFFIEDSRHEVVDDYPVSSVYCGVTNFMAYRKLYSVLPDVFDVAVLMPGLPLYRPHDLGENVPYAVLVSNGVRNIGLPIRDNTGTFGSAGRLKSVIWESFGDIQVFDHEIAHTWGAGVGSSLGLLDPADDVQRGGLYHWNPRADIGGQLSAVFSLPSGLNGTLRSDGSGGYRLDTGPVPYSPLELYIMGVIPPDEVPPIHIVRDVTQPDPYRDPFLLNAIPHRTITIEDITRAQGGKREPSHVESQKQFDVAFMVVQDAAYNDAAYAYFSLLSYALMSEEPPEAGDSFAPFHWATEGRASLSTRLPVEVPEPLGLPGESIPTPVAPPAGATNPPAATTPTRVPYPEASSIPLDPLPRPRFPCGGLPAALVLAAGLGARRQSLPKRRSSVERDRLSPGRRRDCGGPPVAH